MSDLRLRLQKDTSQLPVSSYFHPALFKREMATRCSIAAPAMSYMRSTCHNQVTTTPSSRKANAVRWCRAPTCKWAQSPTSADTARPSCWAGGGTLQAQAKGSAGGNIVCPGDELLGAPHFKHHPCLNLKSYPLRDWSGLLFEYKGQDIEADLAGMGSA